MQLKEIENEKLMFKITKVEENVVGLTEHDKLQSDLNIANSQIISDDRNVAEKI